MANGTVCYVKCFGSSAIRVAPDIAVITVGVFSVQPEPGEAFKHARAAATAVSDFLVKHGVEDFGSSRFSLRQEIKRLQNDLEPVGYRASIGFRIALRNLDKLEAVLTGVISAGANELASIQFETSRISELRDEARQQAVVSAREKATVYCQEAGVSLGKVVAIEDAESAKWQREIRTGGVGFSLDPAMITVENSVFLTFALAANGVET